MRLVDDHPAEAERAEPADVPVEDVVVDDDDVAEGVDVLTVTVDDGGAVLRGPHGGLARPAGLDDVRYDDEQRVGVDGLRGQQGLGGLAETRLVGEQEGAVTVLGLRDNLGLVRHQVEPGRDVRVARVGKGHAGRRAGGGLLERAEQRADQLPVGEQPRPRPDCGAAE